MKYLYLGEERNCLVESGCIYISCKQEKLYNWRGKKKQGERVTSLHM